MLWLLLLLLLPLSLPATAAPAAFGDDIPFVAAPFVRVL